MTFLELHFGRRRLRADKRSEEPSPAQEDAGCYDTDPSAISSGCTMVLKALEVFDIQHSGKMLPVCCARFSQLPCLLGEQVLPKHIPAVVPGMELFPR